MTEPKKEIERRELWLKKQQELNELGKDHYNNYVLPKIQKENDMKYKSFYKFCVPSEKPFESHFVRKGYNLQEEDSDLPQDNKKIDKHQDHISSLQLVQDKLGDEHLSQKIIPKQIQKLEKDIQEFYRFSQRVTTRKGNLIVEATKEDSDCNSLSDFEDINENMITLKFKGPGKTVFSEKISIHSPTKKIYKIMKKRGYPSSKFEARTIFPSTLIPNSKDIFLSCVNIKENMVLSITPYDL